MSRVSLWFLAGIAWPALVHAEGSWWSEAQRGIATAEYEIHWQKTTVLADLPQSWHAPNREHGFRTYFTPVGIRVVPRLASEPDWEWGLSLVGYGRGAQGSAVESATVAVSANRAEYARGGLVEWYVNDPRGLEQGFTLSEPPPPSEEGGPVYLTLALGGTLSPVLSSDGQSVDFVTGPGAAVLRYSKLAVRDAAGIELRAWIEAFNQGGLRGLRLVFDDAGAAYPLEVDPLATTPAWVATAGQAGTHFGETLSTAGDVNGDGYSDVIVGAHDFDNGETDEGRAFVFLGSASGLSTVPGWTAESDMDGAGFGVSVSTAGDVNGDGYSDVVIGALFFQNNIGKAFVYHGSASGLSTTPSWTALGIPGSKYFGAAVSTAGDVNGDGYSDVIIGSNLYTNGQTNEGQASVYHGSAAGLGTSPAWAVEGGSSNEQFGYRVSTAGDVNSDGFSDVLVSRQDFNATTYLYRGTAAGLMTSSSWQFPTEFFPTASAAGDVNGDGYGDVILGDPWEFDDVVHEGMAFVFHGSATGLSVIPSWKVSGGSIDEGLGDAVATAGDVNGDGYADVIVGRSVVADLDAGTKAPSDSDSGIGAHVYFGGPQGLKPFYEWSGGFQGGFGGTWVATAGDVDGDGYADVLLGSYYAATASLFRGSAAGLAAAPRWFAEADQAEAKFGVAVGAAGDVNGDGYADVVVGASGFDSPATDGGLSRVWRGSPSGLVIAPIWSAGGSQAGGSLGTAVASAGDVNGDGYDEVLVGAPGYDNGQPDEGRVFVYQGSPTGPAAAASWTVESDQAFAELGRSVASAGDVDGDGFADVILGAPGYDNGQPDEGRAFVYRGSASGLGTVAAWTAESNQASAAFGSSVAGAGDVQGDGWSDVIVGAPFYDNGQADEGAAFAFAGSAAGLGPSPMWKVEGEQVGATLGASVASAGDVNGDGRADVIVGAPGHDATLTDEGRATVYHGSAFGPLALPGWTATGHQAASGFGASVAGAGDVNGDGFADVIVGANRFDNGQLDEGRAFAYHGSPAGLAVLPGWSAEPNQAAARFGTAVAGAGDVNGDGYADVIVGADGYDNGESNEGRALVYYGNDGIGLALTPQQRRANDSAPIADRGASDAPDAFRLALSGKTPFGRGRVKLEWEVKPLGQAFDGLGTGVSSSSTDTGTAGAALSELQSGLVSGTAYHWRVRLLYDPVTTPFALHSRWLQVPWRGWQEADLRTAAGPAAGVVPDGTTGPPLTVGKSGRDLVLAWGASCLATDDDASIYEGVLGAFESHAPRECSTAGQTSWILTPAAGNAYYLIVPHNGTVEGSYGVDGAGVERPAAAAACRLQAFGRCP